MRGGRVTIYESRLWWGLSVCMASGILVGVAATLYFQWVFSW